jgi:hypothetical protein
LLKKLRKDPSDKEKQHTLIALFSKVKDLHEQVISRLEIDGFQSAEYDPVLQEYNALQKLMDETNDSPIRNSVVLSDYRSSISAVRSSAAGYYYQRGVEELKKDTRTSASAAYDLFGKVQRYSSTYRDVTLLKNQAFERSIVNVLINPVQQGLFSTQSFGSITDQLVKDLGGRSAMGIRARFFSLFDLRNYSVRPDWVVDLLWNRSLVPNKILARYDRLVSKEIQIGRDTSGKPVMRPIYATMHIVRYETAPVEIDFRLVDIEENVTLDWSRLNLGNSQIIEAATFSGDSRAIGDADWQLINRDPTMHMSSQMMNTIYTQLVEELRSRLRSKI